MVLRMLLHTTTRKEEDMIETQEEFLSSTRIEKVFPKSGRIKEFPKSSSFCSGSIVSSNPRTVDFFPNLLSTISSLAPSLIYDRRKAMRKRKRRVQKMVHPELRSIWTNTAFITNPVNVPTTLSVKYPKVDWMSVNKRFLSNVPSPSFQPVMGCSSDPTFYEDEYERNDYGYHHNLGSKFSKPHPFGAALGYLTDAGAIGIPDCVYHGHVYDAVSQGWILHASFEEGPTTQKKKMEERETTQRRMKRKKIKKLRNCQRVCLY